MANTIQCHLMTSSSKYHCFTCMFLKAYSWTPGHVWEINAIPLCSGICEISNFWESHMSHLINVTLQMMTSLIPSTGIVFRYLVSRIAVAMWVDWHLCLILKRKKGDLGWDVVAHLHTFCLTKTLPVELQHSLTSRGERTLLDLFLVNHLHSNCLGLSWNSCTREPATN